jgi:hypothetical protein
MRESLFLIAAGGVFVITTALPASAATSGRTEMTAIDSAGPTTTTFTVTNGALTITTPDSVNLGSGAPGTTIGPTALGTVTVNDNRASASASWAADGLLDRLHIRLTDHPRPRCYLYHGNRHEDRDDHHHVRPHLDVDRRGADRCQRDRGQWQQLRDMGPDDRHSRARLGGRRPVLRHDHAFRVLTS